MNRSEIRLLECILCRHPLELSDAHPSDCSGDDLDFGVLACNGCGAAFPVIDGVGVFFRPDRLNTFLNAREKKICQDLGLNTACSGASQTVNDARTLQEMKNWSFQWNEVAPWDSKDFQGPGFQGEACFQAFIPLNFDDFRDRVAVIWCGGNGREAWHVSSHAPALLIVNEIGDEIYRIAPLLAPHQSRLLLIRCDMLENPLRPGIADYSICDHALQHVVDHLAGFRELVRVLKPGGKAGICVYSLENNFLMTGLVEPAKTVLSRLPLKMVRFLAMFPALILYFLIHCLHLPAERILGEQLAGSIPLHRHMIFWSTNRYHFIWMACFDLMHAPISYNFSQSEMETFCTANHLIQETLINTHGTTWSLIARTS